MKLLNVPLILGIVSCARGPGPVTPQTPVERQMLGLLQKFDRWDYDGDGELDSSEISQGIKSTKGKPQEVNHTAAGVIKFYDTSLNGKVSLTEAQAGYSRADEAENQLRK
jgi:hypothetical protein